MSADLLLLLELNLAAAGMVRFARLLGYSTAPAPPGLSSNSFASSCSCSSSKKGKRGGNVGQLLQQQQKLRVGPSHAPLLEEFGIEEPESMEEVFKTWHK